LRRSILPSSKHEALVPQTGRARVAGGRDGVKVERG
jgi:hypothetical protein